MTGSRSFYPAHIQVQPEDNKANPVKNTKYIRVRAIKTCIFRFS